MTPYAECRRILARHSKSFALAARLLPPAQRDALAAIYAWCREADDAVDLAAPFAQPHLVRNLTVELASIYAGAPQHRPSSACFQEVVRAYDIPMEHPADLLRGLAMDVAAVRYETLADLRRYAFRVAGTVGLMACRVFGVRDALTLVHAAHLGMAMQLTNVCRDVEEDWERGRLYVPLELLPPDVAGELRAGGQRPLPPGARAALRAAVSVLLREADRYYRSADRGIRALDGRVRLAVRTARLIYAEIGDVIAARGYDVAPRAVVPRRRKLTLVARALRSDGRPAPPTARVPPRCTRVRWFRLVVSCAVAVVSASVVLAAPAAIAADPPPLTPGRYRLEMRYATSARLPVIGESASTYRSVSVVDVARDGDHLVQTHRVCVAETEDAIPLFGLDMPPRFLAALGWHRYPLRLTADATGWRYAADLGPEYVGYRPHGERALPETADDPDVFDWDGDGKPGGTIRLRIPIAPDGELYVVQRGHALLDGRVVAPDRVEGAITIPVFEQHVIGARPEFLHRTPEIHTDTSRSRFLLARMPDGSDCAAVVAARSDP
jgi:phytoene synthase